MGNTEKRVSTSCTPGGMFYLEVHRLDPGLRGEFREALQRHIALGTYDATSAARAEIIARFGEQAYRIETIGVLSGGAWWQRLIGRLRVWASNARLRINERRNT